MTALLSWLYLRATRVYNILDWIYGKVVDAALFAWYWAVNEANKALAIAQSYARTLRDYVLDIAWDWIEWVQDTVGGWVDGAKALARELYNAALVVIENVKNYVKDYARNLVDSVYGWAWDLYAGVLVTLENVKNWLLSEVHRLIDPIFGNTDLLNGLLTFFGLPTVFDFLNMLYSFQGSLIAFFQHPLAYVYAVIRSTFLTFLSFAVGYGLGTTKYNLPYWPSWGTDDEIVDWPPDLPPGAGGLSPPLTHIRVSGYTFNHPAGHMGIDLGATSPFVVYAMHAGVIQVAHYLSGGYANCIVLSGSPWWTRYAHLKSFNVGEGETVRAGQPIAIGDSTGNSTGDHLHLEIKYNGSFVDPLPLL